MNQLNIPKNNNKKESSPLEGKYILFINSGSPKKRFILKRAKELGVKIILLNKEEDWAKRFADFFIQADTYNHEDCVKKIEDFLKKQKIDGAVTFWEDDVPLRAKICETFGFVGNSYEAAINCRNKYKMREVLSKNGILCPKFKLIKNGLNHNSEENNEDFENIFKNLNFPAIIKPVWGSMSQFVIRVDNIEEAKKAYEYISSNISPGFDPIYNYGCELMVEEYLDGAEVDVDILIQNGEVKFYSITDNFPTKEPYFVETGDALPSRHPEYIKDAVKNQAERSIKALGIKDGCVHVEAKITSRGPRIIEINARMGGDYIYDWIKSVWCVDLIEEILKIAVGLPIEIKKSDIPKFHLVGKYFIPESSGVVTGIRGLGLVKDKTRIKNVTILKKVGDAVLVPPEGFEQIGWIVGKGNTYAEAEQNLEEAINNIEIKVARYQPESFIGKTKRESRLSAASVIRKRILQQARIEKIRSLDPLNLRPLKIGVLCNKYEDSIDSELRVQKDLTSIGLNIKKALEEKGHKTFFFDMNENPLPIQKITDSNVDIIFNVCERINNSSLFEPHAAAILETLQIPYTGSDAFTLALSIDKIKMKKLFDYHNIPTPKYDYIYSLDEEIDEDLKFPLIVKPANTDNSIGITNESIVTNKEELWQRLKYVIEIAKRPALIEEFIEGDEVDVCIVGNEEDLRVLPLRRAMFENLPQNIWHIYPYNAKWKNSNEDAIYSQIKTEWPAKYSSKLTQLISEIAIDVYNILGCRDYGRVELRVDKDGNPYVLELNPNPSINREDALPAAAELVGLSYENFIEEIIKTAIKRYKDNPPYYHLQSSILTI